MQQAQGQAFKNKREQFTINLRKANREQLLMKKRNINEDNNQQQFYRNTNNPLIIDESLRTYLAEIMKQKFQIKQAIQLITQLDSQDILKKHRAAIGLRKLTSQNALFLSGYLIQKDLVIKLINLYNQKDYPQIKVQLLWVFTNLTSTSKQFTQKLVQYQIIPMIVQDMLNISQFIQYHAIWTTGNIVADNVKYRDQFLLYGSISRILRYLQKKRSHSELLTTIWVLTNLSRGKPAPRYDAVKFVVAPIGHALKADFIKNQAIISDCLWTLANLSQGGKVHVQRVAQTQCIQKVIQHMLNPQLTISIPALRIVGNFTNSTKQQTNLVLQHNFFDNTLKILTNSKDIIIKQLCWAISNITAGTDDQIFQFLQRQDLIQRLLQIYSQKSPQIRTEIIWIFTNMQHYKISQLVYNLYEIINILHMIGQQLKQLSQKCITQSLLCLYKIFAFGQKIKKQGEQNIFVCNFWKLGYTPILQNLQKHQSVKIYRECNKIMQKFFNVEEIGMEDV